MTKLEEALRVKFCPETAGDILLALNEADCLVNWKQSNLDMALTWVYSKQGHDFWKKIRKEERKKDNNISLDIYSL